jgi:hypothetical protein
MLIKNGRMIKDRILKPLQLKNWIRSAPVAVFLGSCALLFGAPLHAQDLLLKEYIYLDGKLLAVERQVLTQAAQQLANDSGREMKFTQYSPSSIRGLTPPDNSFEPGIPVISGIPELCAFHSPVLTQFLCPGEGQSRFVGSEGFNLRYGAYRRYWKVAGISEYKTGGSYDGL